MTEKVPSGNDLSALVTRFANHDQVEVVGEAPFPVWVLHDVLTDRQVELLKRTMLAAGTVRRGDKKSYRNTIWEMDTPKKIAFFFPP